MDLLRGGKGERKGVESIEMWFRDGGVELHCPVQINSSLRHYGRSTDPAELRGREDARGITGRCRERRGD